MDESTILRKYDKNTLKNIALNKGLSSTRQKRKELKSGAISFLTNDELRNINIERYIHTRNLTSVLDDIDRDKKVVVAKDIVMEKPKSSKNIYTYTFAGTKEQIDSLIKYAKEELWMEV